MDTSDFVVNQEAVHQAIRIMERVVKRKDRFNMAYWQSLPNSTTKGEDSFCETETEAHSCGMAACFGGWVAMSPEWKVLGGKVDGSGGPLLVKANSRYFGADAIAVWLNIPTWKSNLLTCTGCDTLSRSGFYDGKRITDITATDVIGKLKAMLI